MSGAEGVAFSPGAAEGFPDLRSVVGAHSADQKVGITVDTNPQFFARVDCRGKPHQTVMVHNTGAEVVLVTLRWYVNETDWIEQYNVAAGATDFQDRQRAAHHLVVEIEAAQNTSQVTAAAVATI